MCPPQWPSMPERSLQYTEPLWRRRQYSSEDIQRCLFPRGKPQRTLKQLKQDIARNIKKLHARN
jgi:hypothetical protein